VEQRENAYERKKKRELKNVYDSTMRFMKNKLLNIKVVCNFLHQKCITVKYNAVNKIYARFIIQIQI